MKNPRVLLLALLFALSSSTALAADEQPCSDSTRLLLGQALGLHSMPKADDPLFTAEACKVAPWDKNTLIAAVAYSKSSENSDDRRVVLIATIDVARKAITRQNKTQVEEDAVTEYGPGSLSIDTARYQLAPDVRAFGVRFNSTARGPSCADGNSSNELTLYVPAKSQLTPVLTLNMFAMQALQGCIGSATGRNVLEDATLGISLENSSSHGYADLKVTASIVPDGDMDVPPKHLAVKKHSESWVLHYDGKSYDVVNGSKWWLMK